jgi:hypothetical protein
MVVQLRRAEDLLLLQQAEIRQGRVLDQTMRDIDAEAVGPGIEPEPKHIQELLPHVRVAPVQVGLLGVEQMQVPLARRPV